ncbi:MAG: hypothetical protein ACLFU1_08100 [Alphaproteobacteria bacterium]
MTDKYSDLSLQHVLDTKEERYDKLRALAKGAGYGHREVDLFVEKVQRHQDTRSFQGDDGRTIWYNKAYKLVGVNNAQQPAQSTVYYARHTDREFGRLSKIEAERIGIRKDNLEIQGAIQDNRIDVQRDQKRQGIQTEEPKQQKESQTQKVFNDKGHTQEQTTENKEQKGVRIELFAGENTQAKKVLNAQTAKAEINTALENKGIGKINGTDKARFEAIRDRAEQKAIDQGSSPDVAKGVALNKLYGVMARYEQMKDRARVYEKPTKKEADAHMHRANDLNDKIIETRKQNAALTGQSYTGLQPKSEEHKQAFVSHGSYALRSRAKLALVRADLENEGKYEDEKERIEKNIAKNKTIDLKPFEQERSQQNDQSEQYGMGHGVTLAHLDNAATQYAQHMAQAQKEGEQEQSNTKSFGGHELSM